MSVEALDENPIKSNEPVVKKHEFRRLTVEEIFKRRKKRRRGYPRRLLKKWLKEKTLQKVMLQRGTIDFPRMNLPTTSRSGHLLSIGLRPMTENPRLHSRGFIEINPVDKFRKAA